MPGLRASSIFLVALSLSIGWGIRGNFGHEYGAMIAGTLAAIAVCLLSGREDWRRRVHYFAMFGALGWAFGGSMSYGQVIAYTHSGHGATRLYGFGALFVIGFLWAALGGAGTAFPAVADEDRLTKLFRPICWVFVGWLVMGIVAVPFLEHFEGATVYRHEDSFYWLDADWRQAFVALAALFAYDLWDRRREPGHGLNLLAPFVAAAVVIAILFAPGLGWWLSALLFVVAVALLVVWNSRTASETHVLGLAVFGLAAAFVWGAAGPIWLVLLAVLLAVGLFLVWEWNFNTPHLGLGLAIAGVVLALVFWWLDAAWLRVVAAALALLTLYTWDREGDKSHRLVLYGGTGAWAGYTFQALLRSAGWDTGFAEIFVQYQGDTGAFPREQLVMNWPEFFQFIPEHLGWIFGLLAGVCLYFALHGKFRSGASLLVHMAAGWLIAFLVLPTLGSLLVPEYGGLRMTPPRSDDWAGILGVFLGTMVYMVRNGLLPVVWASLVSGIVGGVGFSGAQMMKLVMVYPGNPKVFTDPQVIQAWAHWRSANWHSWLEQTYGFINGLGIALALGLLATRAARLQDGPQEGRSQSRRWPAIFAVAFVVFLVTFLNLQKNVTTWVERGVPAVMKAPLFQSIEWSAFTWFTLVYGLMAVLGIALMVRHTRRPIAIAPSSWLGAGQLLYLVFLWMMVVGNFERALMGFAEGRLITEWVILIHAIIVTGVVLVCPKDSETVPERPATRFAPLVVGTLCIGVVVTAAAIAVEFGVARALYGDTFAGHAGDETRFGPDAAWRTEPVLKGTEHR